MRKNSGSGPLQQRKTGNEGTWRQDVLTENKHPGRRTRCSLNIDATASRRVRPSSIKLKNFHLPSATAVWGGPRSGATSLCMIGAGRAKLPHVAEETELLLTSTVADHLLSLRVDLSKRTHSQVDGIQGAALPSGTRALQG